MLQEAEKAGGLFKANSAWFIERQIEEYALADVILAPSLYSARSYPAALQSKIVLAPLYGRSRIAAQVERTDNSTFVVGVVGNDPLRKGYLYLLQAWKELALPRAQLKIRSSANFAQYSRLAELLADQPTVSVIDYVPDIASFYAGCDAFILPSVDEGFGMALFEALAHGVPCIATRNCGAAELLAPERDALIIDACSVEQIKESLLRLYRSEELRQQLRVAGPAAVEALQQGDLALPYEAGIDTLLRVLPHQQKVTA